MSDNIELAIQLLIVGMLSVFLILAIVTGLARLLILIVNRFGSVEPMDNKSSSNRNTIPEHVAVITATVDIITDGKGKVHSIKKL